MRVFAKVNGQLACWELVDVDHDEAIKQVREELGAEHKSAVLALVKY
jgi:hypothetical protein